MEEGQKRAISLRLSPADLRRVKRMSERLGVRDCHLIRYAIKGLLRRLSPLTDPAIKGRSLVPLFLDGGADLVQQFELDIARLETIINGGVESPHRVSTEDLHLIAMAAEPTSSVAARTPAPGEQRVTPARRYLYEKYLYRSDMPETAASEK